MNSQQWQRLKFFFTAFILALALVAFSADLARAVSSSLDRSAPAAQGDAPAATSPVEIVKSDRLVDDADGNGQASPGDTIEYTVVITNNGPADALGLIVSDVIDANTTLSGTVDVYPVAVRDDYDVLGNTAISIAAASGLLANDFDPDNGAITVVPVAEGTTVEGGEIIVNADGSFEYDPPAGYSGIDSFTYTIEDADGLRSTGTVTFTISEVIWYVDDDAPAGGDGRLSAPFATLAAAQVASGAGDILFVFSGSYADGITLKNNQMLVGQGVSLASGAELVPPAGTTLPPSATAPVISQRISTGRDNTIRGLTINSDGNGLTGSNFGTLTIGNVTISARHAISLTNGTLNAAFDGLTSSDSATNGIALTQVNGNMTVNSGAITSATGSAIFIDGGSANLTYPGNIENSTGHSVQIINRTGGTVTLAGNITDSGSGILLLGNSGGVIAFSGSSKVLDTGSNTALSLVNNSGSTIQFSNGGLQITTTSGIGLNATGGGALTITGAGNTIASSAARAVSIDGVSLTGDGITLESVTATNSSRGIVLKNAGSGGFTVTGLGDTDGSGGLIQDISQRGIEVENTNNVSFSNLNLVSANTLDAGGADVCDTLNTRSCNAAIYLYGVSGAAFNNVNISGDIAEQGINGISVSNFHFANGVISNCGDAFGEGCIKMRNLSGNSSISGSDISFAHEKNVEIHNNSGILTLTIEDSTFSDTQSSGDGADGLEIFAANNANVELSVADSNFLRNATNGFAASAAGTAIIDVEITGSTFDPQEGPGIAINLNAINNSRLNLDVRNNPVAYSNGGPAINVAAFDQAVIAGHISGNSDIQVGGAETSGSGIRVQVNDNASGALIVENNTISNIGWDSGIAVTSRPDLLSAPNGRLDVTIRNNHVTITPQSSYGIDVMGTGSNTTCAYVTGNTVDGAGIAAFRARESGGGTVYLQGFNGSATGTWTANGNSGEPVSESGSPSAPPLGTCQTPPQVQVPAVEVVLESAEPLVAVSVGVRPSLSPQQRELFTQQTQVAGSYTAARHTPASATTLAPALLPQPMSRLASVPPAQSAPDVEVGPFDLPAGHSAKIVFRVTIEQPFPAGAAQISNQASVSGIDLETVLSDDPDTPEPHDPTVTELLVEADLSISKSNGLAEAVPGEPVTYTIVATNSGPNHVGSATVSDTFPAELKDITWECEAAPGASCAASGAGDIDEMVELDVGSSITFTVNATIDAGATGTLSNQVFIATPDDVTDPQLANNSDVDETILTPQVDLTLEQTESADPVVAGSGSGNLTYVITVTNNGPSDASNISITEVITRPAGVTVHAVEYNVANASYSNGEWTIADLDVGRSEQLTVTLTVRSNAAAGSDVIGYAATISGADQTLINSKDDQVSEMTSVTRQVDLEVTMTESADPVIAGSGADNLSYVVTVTNHGPSIASGVTVSNDLSLVDGVTDWTITASDSTSWDTETGLWSIGALSPDDSATLSILLTVGPSAAVGTDVISNEASLLTVNEEDMEGSNDSASHSTSIETEADLVLEKRGEPDPVAAGAILTYTMVITNNGPSHAQNVLVTDSLPEGVSLLRSDGCSEDPAGAPDCSLGTVEAGQTVSYTLQVAVDSAWSGSLSNSAIVSSDTTEAHPDDESDMITTTVNQVADLRLTISNDPDSALAGEPFTYTLALTNSGPSVATNVVATASLPSTFNYSGDDCGGSENSGNWTWNAGTMAVGGSANCAITGTVSAAYSGLMSIQGSVSSDATDPQPDDNEVTETTTVYDNQFLIGDAAVEEGDSGTTVMTFTITRTTNVNSSSVDVQTVDVPGSAVAGEDYTSLPLTTIEFVQGGALAQTITVDVSGDNVVELDEVFLVVLSNPRGGRLSDDQATATGTIINDDSATVSIEGESRAEGDTGSTTYVFTATLSAEVDTVVEVDFNTADGSATVADGDYEAQNGTLAFEGLAGEEQTLTVIVKGDEIVELDETFQVQLSNLAAAGRDVTIAGAGEAQGTILNDDTAMLTIVDVEEMEGDSGTTTFLFTVTLSAAVDSTLSVDYATADDTAQDENGDGDYASASGTLNFVGAAGEEQTITVVVNGDTTVELDETFLLNLSNLSAAGRDVTLANSQAVGTIRNDDNASLSIIDTSHLEGDDISTNYVFTVTLSAAVDSAVTVDYATKDGTAEDENGDGDYAATSGTLVFSGNAGEEQTVTVEVYGDAVVELDETFFLQLSNVKANGRAVTLAGDGQGEGTIVNDDSASLTIGDVSLPEGDSGTTRFTFTVTLSAAVDSGVSIAYATSDGTAEDENGDADYVSTSGTLTFTGTAGEEQVVIVDVNGDTHYEPDEQFYVELNNLSAAGRQVTIDDDQGVGEIINDDGPPSITIADTTVSEAAGTAVFTVTLSNASSQPVSVEYGTADGTATAASGDYTAIPTTTLTIPAGAISGTISVVINDDALYEGDETFVINLAAVPGVEATLIDTQATGTIVDNDAPPVLTIDDVTVDEAAGNAEFTVTLDTVSGLDVSATYSTSDGTAISGLDYVAATGAISIPAGALSDTITVSIIDDALHELDETFTVNLSNPVNATIGDGQGVGLIVDNDPAPTLSIAGVTVDEGAGTAKFDVTLSAPSGLDVSVEYETIAGTAIGGEDYVTISGTLTIAAGDVAGAIHVPIIDDNIAENDESFTVELTNPTNATLDVAQATGIITDNDSAVVDFAHAAMAAGESSGAATITVTLSIAAAFPVTVDYASSDGTALAGSDYEPVSGTLRFEPGITEQSFDVPLLADDLNETDETVLLTLSNATGAMLGEANNPATLTIVDDDGEPTVHFSDFNYSLPEAGASATITVTLSHLSGQEVSVDYASSDGTAVAGVDYEAVQGTVTIPPGQMATSFTVPISDDVLYEADETIILTLSNPVHATVGAVNPATLTIIDDDPLPQVQFDSSAYRGLEGDIVAITVTLSAVSGLDTSVNYATSDGSATAGTDYTAISGTLTIPAGQTVGALSVPLAADDYVEADETVEIALSAPVNAVLGEQQRSTLTIVDNSFTAYAPLIVQAVTYAPEPAITPLTAEDGTVGAAQEVGNLKIGALPPIYDILHPFHNPCSGHQPDRSSSDVLTWSLSTDLLSPECSFRGENLHEDKVACYPSFWPRSPSCICLILTFHQSGCSRHFAAATRDAGAPVAGAPATTGSGWRYRIAANG